MAALMAATYTLCGVSLILVAQAANIHQSSSNKEPTSIFVLADTTPINMPTVSPWVSDAHFRYWPAGDQHGKILATTWGGLWDAGGGNLPVSNDYTIALGKCTAMCDSNMGCLSFNVFTASENDFNNGIPTWICRFSNQVYDPSQYYVENGTPSFVWTIDPANHVPDCNTSAESPNTPWMNPTEWQNRNMPMYMHELSRAHGLEGSQSGYLGNLMSFLGKPAYQCLDDQTHACYLDSSIQVHTCGDWLDYQEKVFQYFMNNNENILTSIMSHITNKGEQTWDSFWWTQLPSSSSFDPIPLIEAVITGGLALIPEVGGVTYYVANSLTTLISSLPGNQGLVYAQPDLHDSWVAFRANVSDQIDRASSAIYQLSKDVPAVQTLFSTHIADMGSFCLSASGNNLTPSVDQYWPSVSNYYLAKIAQQSMQAQSVFLLLYATPPGACNQAAADRIAGYVTPGVKGVAFCDGDSHVIVPIVGWNPNVYNQFGNTASSSIGSSVTQVFESSFRCYMKFGPAFPSITLYNTASLLPSGSLSTGNMAYDLSQTCAWALPICSSENWQPYVDADGGPTVGQRSTDPQVMTSNLVAWCSYNFGFVSQLRYCGYYFRSNPNSPLLSQCSHTNPKKRFNIVPAPSQAQSSSSFAHHKKEEEVDIKAEVPKNPAAGQHHQIVLEL